MDIRRPSSLDIRAKACNDASLRLVEEASKVFCCRVVERASMRCDMELPIRPMRAAASYALDKRSSVTRHWGRGHLASGLRASSEETMREAMVGSIAGIWSRPNFDASCMAAKARASEVGWERALVFLQHACNSLRYSSEGGTVKLAVAGVCA